MSWDMPAQTSTNGDAWGVADTNGHASNGFGDDGFGNGDSGAAENGGDQDAPGDDRGCYNCGETGHMKSDCPKPRDASAITCRVCNQVGHFSKDCPDAEPMKCHRCGEDGHMVKECPQPQICKNCGGEGHGAGACTEARLVDRRDYPDMSPDAAWQLIVTASKERDLDDVKTAVQTYVKATPETTYVQLEEAFRNQEVGVYLIAIKRPYTAKTMTNMDLQGNMDKKYTVTYRFSPNAPRPREREMWPKTPEKNLERLKDAGEIVDRGVPKCSNCDEMGHIAKSCPEEKRETDTVKNVKCFNCDGEGHRVRDCPTPRVDKFACKNCGKGGHISKECPEPRSAEGVECRKCNEIGHFSKDCPKFPAGPRGCRNCGNEDHKAADCTEPKNMANVQCRNCDEFGHTGKECPKPRDYSRVKCSNCQEMGHTKVRCKNPTKAEDEDNANGGGGFDNNGGGGFDNSAPAEEQAAGGEDSWGTSTTKPTDDW